MVETKEESKLGIPTPCCVKALNFSVREKGRRRTTNPEKKKFTINITPKLKNISTIFRGMGRGSHTRE